MWRWILIVWLTVSFVDFPTPLVRGQATTTTLLGHVTDAATGQALPFANVYLNGTTRGTLTDDQGRFTLASVSLGTVEIVASFVGYLTDRRTLRLEEARSQPVSFRLKLIDQTLATVTVKANRNDKAWLRQLRRFSQQLLGEPFGNQCAITNAHVLSFTDNGGHLKAFATEPLIIDNQALGYRLYYDLLYFDGSLQRVYYAGNARFEEIKPTDERQATRFRRNRIRAYTGSTRHLLASLVTNTYEQEGFLVYKEDLTIPITQTNGQATLTGSIGRRLRPLVLTELIQPGQLPFERRLVSDRQLVIFFTKAASAYSPYRDARYAYSQLKMPAGSFQFTTDGTVTSPNGMELQGSLADDRLSTLLPADWKPNAGVPDSLANAPVLTRGKLLAPDKRLKRLTDDFNERFRYLAPSVFVHTDKPLYATGDRLWLSAYLLDAATLVRPVGETALHVDVLSAGGRLVQHQWLKVTDGRAVGNFRLSDTLVSGTYYLRAYTDEDDGQRRPAFERPVAVYNLLRGSGQIRSTGTSRPVDAQFLPEGGRWVVGIPARLGVKLTDPDGQGRSRSGQILDDQGTEVARFVTNVKGMGSVVLTPQPGRTYRADVLVDGQKTTVSLPPPETEGLTLAIDAVSDSSSMQLTIAGPNRPALDSAYVLVQQRGKLTDQRKILLQNGLAQVRFPLALFPAGLLQLTLYDAAARPQAERLIYVPDRLPPVRVRLVASKLRYLPRESVMLDLTLTDDNQPAMAALSVSITDVGQLPDDTAAANARTHLLLTGELRGRVEQPDVYLKDNTPETRRALDDLLLTQGWRRVRGTADTDLLGGVSVVGRVLNAKNQPIGGAQVMLASTVSGQSFVRSAGTDERGRFRLAGLAIADTISLMAQLTDRQFKNLSDKEARLVLDGPEHHWPVSAADTLADWVALRAYLDAANVRQEADPDLYRDRRVKLLKEVTVRAKKRDETEEAIRRMSLHNAADAVIRFDDKSPRYTNLYEMLRGQVPGVTVSQTSSQTSAGGGYRVIVRGIGTFQSSTQPLYLMDGMPITGDEETSLLSFNPGDIERIEVLKNAGSAGIYGVRGSNGIIAFYTKRAGSTSSANVPKASTKTMSFIGYPSVQREFYVPRYEGQPDENARVDRRDVLYWKPIIQTDNQGRTRLLFPLSDVVRTLRVTVQGITTDGRPVSHVEQIQVQ